MQFDALGSHKVILLELHLYKVLVSQGNQCNKVRSATSMNGQNILSQNSQSKQQFSMVNSVQYTYFLPNCTFDLLSPAGGVLIDQV